MQDIEGIERATLAAVPPQRLEEFAGWLVPLDPGTVGRAHSAVPLRHEPPAVPAVEAIEALYRQAGLPPMFRLPQLAAVEGVLERRGYAASKPTLVQVAGIAIEPGPLPRAEGELDVTEVADGSWESVFLGEGFDPVDGASRLDILRRAQGSLYASVRLAGVTVAVGCGAYGHGWGSVHGMRTLPAHRGRGHAARIIAALAAAGRARGVQRMFLQVEQGNAPARALYARLGFTDAWTYRYWKKA